jgi:HEAT repeat protein
MQRLLWVVLAWWLTFGGRVPALEPPVVLPILFTPFLGKAVGGADHITLVRVLKVEKQSRTVIFRKVADLKGNSFEEIRHQFSDSIPAERRQEVLDWAAGRPTAIIFQSGLLSRTCMGNAWLLASADEVRAVGEAEMYVGSVEKLREAVVAILAGKEVVVTVPAPVRSRPEEPSPVVRDWLWGKKGRVCRVRASLVLSNQRAVEECKGGYLVAQGSSGPEAVPGLVAALRHKDPRTRAEAAVDLGQLDPPARDALAALRTTLHDSEGRVRVFAAEALVRIDPGNRDSIPTLRAGLKDRETATRRAAAVALLDIGSVARPALSALVSALDAESDPQTRAVLTYALGRRGPDTSLADCSCQDMVRALGKALRRETNAEAQVRVVRALRKFGPEAKAALPDLVVVLKDSEDGRARQAADLLARQGREGAALLAAALTEKSSHVRRLAAEHLEDLGPHSKEVVPALRKALADEDSEVRESAVRALLRIDHPVGVKEGVPVLVRMVEDKTHPYRSVLVRRLGELGPEARAAVPTLIDLLAGPPSHERDQAVFALGDIGPGAAAAVPALFKAVRTGKSHERRIQAAAALTRIAPNAEETATALTLLLRAKEADLSQWAALELLSLGHHPEALAVFRQTPWNQLPLRSLGRLGPRAAGLLPRIQGKLRKNDDPELEAGLALAVRQIGRCVPCGEFVVDEQQEATDRLVKIIGDPKVRCDLTGVWGAVAELGVEARPLVPVILAGFKDRHPVERLAILDCLGWVGPGAISVVPFLERELKTCRAPGERLAVAMTLAKLEKGRSAVPVLLECLETGELSNWPDWVIVRLLGSLKGQAKPAVPFLLRALRQESREGYLDAAAALFRIDPEAAAREGILELPRLPDRGQIGVQLPNED